MALLPHHPPRPAGIIAFGHSRPPYNYFKPMIWPIQDFQLDKKSNEMKVTQNFEDFEDFNEFNECKNYS